MHVRVRVHAYVRVCMPVCVGTRMLCLAAGVMGVGTDEGHAGAAAVGAAVIAARVHSQSVCVCVCLRASCMCFASE